MSVKARTDRSFPVLYQVEVGVVMSTDDPEHAEPEVVALSLIGDYLLDRLNNDEKGPFTFEFHVPGAPFRQRVTIENIAVAANSVGPTL